MLIRLDDIEAVQGKTSPLEVKAIVTRKDHSEDISVTWVKIWGHHKKMVCDVSDRPYYIIEGEGEFWVGDQEPVKVTSGDTVFIPRGVPYSFGGHMTYLVMNGPAFVPGSDQMLE